MHEKGCWSLLEDETFVRWLLHPDTASNRHWETWIGQDPGRAQAVAQARDVLRQLQRSSSITGQSALRKEVISQEIWKSVQEEMQAEAVERLFRSRSRSPWWAVAATLAVLLSSGVLLWYAGRRSATLPVQAVTLKTPPGNSPLTCSNATGKPEKIYLVDGSVVTLEPHSTLSYARFLDKKSREVTLQGNAFFDIAKDPKRPFLVHSGDLVTRVLGTSFRVIADPHNDDIQVVVKTGKVSVYKKTDFESGHPAFCVLLPHQEAVFHKKEHNLSFQPNADAHLIPPIAEAAPLNFDDVSITEIFGRLESMYHIHILYNSDSLKECRLTTSLQEETLNDKLDIICKAINAGYHTQGDDIVIEGGHCSP